MKVSQGWQVEVARSVWAACDRKGDDSSFLHLLPTGVFSFVSGSLKKNPQKRKKSHQPPLKTDLMTATY